MYSRTRCRVEASQCERFRLFAEVSSGPLVCHPKHARVQAENLSGLLIRMCRIKYIITQITPNKKSASVPRTCARFFAFERQFSKCRCRSVSRQSPRADDNPREFRKQPERVP